jgi:hypothetical protein
MRRALILTTALAMVAGLVVVACGGDDSNPAGPKDAGNDQGTLDTGAPDSNGGDAADAGPLEFTVYTHYLIMNSTSDTTQPAPQSAWDTLVDTPPDPAVVFPPSFF